MIGMAYLTAERALTELGAMFSQFLWIYFSGIVLFFGVESFNEVNVNVMEYATLLFPPWTLLACLFEIWSAEITAELYNRQRTVPSLPSFPEGATIVTTVSVRTWRVVFPTWTYALAAAKEEEDHSKTPHWYSSPCEGATIVSFTHSGVLLELLFLVLNGVVYLGIRELLHVGLLQLARGDLRTKADRGHHLPRRTRRRRRHAIPRSKKRSNWRHPCARRRTSQRTRL
ncbi:uncharacterized protein LOC142767399 [Rhipicephalus microplus]|uniref:uncharacterized protein LOC142767399 n=1 Tax=Rhipicephalus microplus TaxID=6941 RepID=UPI003F6D0D53